MPRRRPTVEEDEGPSKAWMESYADAMTLLLAFFIMMFAFALVDEQKFIDFKAGMVEALAISDPVRQEPGGLLLGGSGAVEVPGVLPVSTDRVTDIAEQLDRELGDEVTPDEAEALRQLLQEALDALGVGDLVAVELDERGVVIRFDDRVLFPSGSNQLVGDGSVVLGHVATVLRPVDNHVSVEGHTDDVPTSGTTWPTNWELSTGRATTVLRHFTELGGIPAPRLSATGYADTRPRASNRDDAGRQQNRRVEVVVVIEGLAQQMAPATSSGSTAGATTSGPGVGTGIDTGIDPGIRIGTESPVLGP